MKRSWVFVLALGGANAFALKTNFCEPALLRPVEHVARQLDFAGLRPGRPPPDTRLEIARTALERGVSVLTNDRGRAFGLVFDSRPGRHDRGYILRGELTDESLRVSSVRQSMGPEKLFFVRLAESRAVPPLRVRLPRTILNCDEVVLAGWTQVKLAMKHRLTMDEVSALLRRSTAPAVWASVWDAHDRYVIDDADEGGRMFRMVIEEAECPHGLITAFPTADPS